MPTTIFVLDEDPVFLREMDRILSSAGHRVVYELDGERALGVLNDLDDSIGLAIIDFVTQKIPGLEIIGTIRKRSSMKIIATLPPRGPDLTQLARNVGADVVVRRPRAGTPLDDDYWLTLVRNVLGEEESRI